MTSEEVRSRFQTLAISLLVLGVSFAIFQNSTLGEFYKWPISGYFSKLEVVTWVLLVASAVVSFFGAIGKFQYGTLPAGDADSFARRMLPAVVSAVLVLDGLIIILSGGATHSCFVHFLGATCGISLIFAERFRPRMIILGVTFATYAITMQYYWPEAPQPQLDRVAELQRAIMLERSTAEAHLLTFAISVGLAALAAWSLQLPKPLVKRAPSNPASAEG
jgi:hypothetical protein